MLPILLALLFGGGLVVAHKSNRPTLFKPDDTDPSVPPQPQPGAWMSQREATFEPGRRYRYSFAYLPEYATAEGVRDEDDLTIVMTDEPGKSPYFDTEHGFSPDQIPADWPNDDHGPRRIRIDLVMRSDVPPLTLSPTSPFARAGVKVYVFVPSS